MTLHLPVIAPECCTVHGRQPLWSAAWADPGHLLFDPRGYCYLHLPYGGGDYDEPDEVTCRVFWDRRLYREQLYRKRIKSVELDRDGEGLWWWLVVVG